MINMRSPQDMKDSKLPWIKEIPCDWKVRRGKTILTLLKRPVLENDGVVTCFRDGEVTLRSNRREDGFTNSLKEIGYQGVEPGDLVVHGMDGFAGAIGVSDSRGKMSPIINVMDSTENKRFLTYYLRAMASLDVFLSMSTGIRERSCDLRWNKLADFPFIIPELNEQQAIADYLDDRCAKIDAIIDEAKASIEEYKELKQAVIYETVTKGLDKDVKVKNIASIGVDNIPVDWKKIKIHHLVSMPVIDGPHVSPELVSDGIPYISANAIENGKINFDKKRGYITHEYNVECQKRYKPQKNDILVVKLGATTGKMAMVEEDTNFNIWVPLAVVRCKKEINAKFVFFAMQSDYFQKEIQNGWTYGTQETLGVKTLDNLYVFIPPKKEQDHIVNYLEKKIPKFDELISEKQSLIEDLEAYKKSLIYEVVTGKRKVVA